MSANSNENIQVTSPTVRSVLSVASDSCSLLDALSDACAVLDSAGVIRYVNTTWQRLLEEHHKNDVIIGSDYARLFASALHDLAPFAQALESVAQGNRDSATLTYHDTIADGTPLITIVLTPCLIHGARGVMVHRQERRCDGTCAAHDTQKHDDYQQIIEGLPFALIEWDAHGMIQQWNAHAEELFGWTAEEMLGKAITPLLSQSTLSFGRLFRELCAQPPASVHRISTPTNHDNRVCRWYNILVMDETGDPTRVVSLIDDLTELIQAERDHTDIQERMIEAQQEALRELATPMIPLNEQTVVMPLIGWVDRWRVQHILRALLDGIERTRARTVIIDMTGVPDIEAQIANELIDVIRSATLLGARVIVTGIRPSLAQTLIHLDVPLHDLPTCSTLQQGIAMAMAHQSRRVRR